MSSRISPLWWPVLALASPLLAPKLYFNNVRYRKNVTKARQYNDERIEQAGFLELPELTRFELTVLVEQRAEQGYKSAPGVSYLIKTDLGTLLFDLGYGPEDGVFAKNAERLDFSIDQVDAVAISHLHPDHMGGFKAAKKKRVALPHELGTAAGMVCFVPDRAGSDQLHVELVDKPQMLVAGIASTGPLARGLFLMGWTEEQAIVARLKGKGLVVFTGCGHPTIETIVRMVRKLSDEPIYAIGGGLHFPVTDSPLRKPGLKVQMIWGTGKPPWKRITEEDLERTLHFLNDVRPERVFLSAHDTCDYSITRLENDLHSQTTVLRAGATYSL